LGCWPTATVATNVSKRQNPRQLIIFTPLETIKYTIYLVLRTFTLAIYCPLFIKFILAGFLPTPFSATENFSAGCRLQRHKKTLSAATAPFQPFF